MFEIGKDYTRDDIHSHCGGNKQAFLPVYKGKVVAACLRPDLNPHAPDVILCNSGGAARAAGRTLAKQIDPIPVFIRQQTDKWRYVGNFSPIASLTTPNDCAPFARNSSFTAGQVSRVIKLKRC
ncbi:DUF6697 family protein [Chitinivorax sp. B]|uniref:DUF6697 family protein n=1 Tax=Chitinivorax sp. B TaxID=2502235 RepID=UPI0010F639AB|nr:DUF6697 family protein [Chitinivorax sp. B]